MTATDYCALEAELHITGIRPVHEIPARRAIEFLSDETDGRIFSVYFQKVGGDMRQMTCRRGVSKHLTGGKLRYDAKAKSLLTVFDMSIRDYRMVNLSGLVSFNIGGETFIVVD